MGPCERPSRTSGGAGWAPRSEAYASIERVDALVRAHARREDEVALVTGQAELGECLVDVGCGLRGEDGIGSLRDDRDPRFGQAQVRRYLSRDEAETVNRRSARRRASRCLIRHRVTVSR